jgi:hypothetical protein
MEMTMCVCCGERFKEHDLAVCTMCGGSFHLALRTDVEVRDCGDVWINEELDGIEFGCNRCLGLMTEVNDAR